MSRFISDDKAAEEKPRKPLPQTVKDWYLKFDAILEDMGRIWDDAGDDQNCELVLLDLLDKLLSTIEKFYEPRRKASEEQRNPLSNRLNILRICTDPRTGHRVAADLAYDAFRGFFRQVTGNTAPEHAYFVRGIMPPSSSSSDLSCLGEPLSSISEPLSVIDWTRGKAVSIIPVEKFSMPDVFRGRSTSRTPSGTPLAPSPRPGSRGPPDKILQTPSRRPHPHIESLRVVQTGPTIPEPSDVSRSPAPTPFLLRQPADDPDSDVVMENAPQVRRAAEIVNPEDWIPLAYRSFGIETDRPDPGYGSWPQKSDMVDLTYPEERLVAPYKEKGRPSRYINRKSVDHLRSDYNSWLDSTVLGQSPVWHDLPNVLAQKKLVLVNFDPALPPPGDPTHLYLISTFKRWLFLVGIWTGTFTIRPLTANEKKLPAPPVCIYANGKTLSLAQTTVIYEKEQGISAEKVRSEADSKDPEEDKANQWDGEDGPKVASKIKRTYNTRLVGRPPKKPKVDLDLDSRETSATTKEPLTDTAQPVLIPDQPGFDAAQAVRNGPDDQKFRLEWMIGRRTHPDVFLNVERGSFWRYLQTFKNNDFGDWRHDLLKAVQLFKAEWDAA